MQSAQTIPAMLVDGHVHFHPCYDAIAFLDAAEANFTAAAKQLNMPEGTLGCLLLSESSWHDYFRAFANGLLAKAQSPWRVEPTMESCSLIACREGEPRLIIIAGRQVVTSERLEVLALACNRAFPDGMPIEAVLESVLACGAVTVIPWGFGKWWGRRGRTMRKVLESDCAKRIFLGDNGGRPAGARQPALFKLAQRKQIGILPGTDPLDMPWQARKPGRYGFILQQPTSLQTPAATLRAALCDNTVQPPIYGRRDSLFSFARANIALRLNRSRPTSN